MGITNLMTKLQHKKDDMPVPMPSPGNDPVQLDVPSPMSNPQAPGPAPSAPGPIPDLAAHNQAPALPTQPNIQNQQRGNPNIPAPPIHHERTSRYIPKRWQMTDEVNSMREQFEGIIIDIGENMSINVPIKKRMNLDDFLKLAERVKRIEELDMTQMNEQNEEYH